MNAKRLRPSPDHIRVRAARRAGKMLTVFQQTCKNASLGVPQKICCDEKHRKLNRDGIIFASKQIGARVSITDTDYGLLVMGKVEVITDED